MTLNGPSVPHTSGVCMTAMLVLVMI